MKRLIRSSTISEIVKNISSAKKALSSYSNEQIEYVKECRDEMSKEISKYYTEEDTDRHVGSKLSEIKRDYLVGAIEDELMTETEFDDIFDLLDVIDLEMAHSFA